MIMTAKVVGEKDGQLYLTIRKPANYQNQMSALVELCDPRMISPQQRKKAYVLMHYIADWAGYTPLEIEKVILKSIFLTQGIIIKDCGFSLSNCTKTEARLFITWLVDFCLVHNVPIGRDILSELCDDVPRFVWACAVNKRCAVCGRKAELHHAKGGTVGMGNNRHKIDHLGRPCLPLCREHHMIAHNMGHESFCKKYFLEPVKIDERILEVYNLGRGNNYGNIESGEHGFLDR